MIYFPLQSSSSPDDKTTTTKITVICDLCDKLIYASTEDSSTVAIHHQKSPYKSSTYKIYCERCYMTPLLKIKELTTILEEYKNKEDQKIKREAKRRKTQIEKEKKKLDEINNELY